MTRWIPIVAVLLSGCGGDLRELEDARQKWLTEGSDTYVMTVTQNCFCPENEPVLVDVVGSAVRTATIQSSEGEIVVESQNFRSWYTINGLFDEIEAAINDNVAGIEVTYADKLGYPQEIMIDVDQLAADDDYGWTVSGLQMDPAGVGTGGGQ